MRPHNHIATMATAMVAVIVALASIAVAPAGAAPLKATLYVATTGSDTANTCTTSSAPCLTITYALSQLPTVGGTIKVAAGTYNEQVNINVPVSLIGSGASSTFIHGTGLTLNYPNYGLVNIGDVPATVKGFTLENTPNSPDFAEGFNFVVQTVSAYTVSIVQNSVVGSDPADTYPIGVYELANSATTLNVSQNTFSNLYQGVFLENGGKASITQNNFTGFFNDGTYAPAAVFILAHNQATVSNQTISQNTVSGYAGWGIVLEAGYPAYGGNADQGTITGAALNQNRFALNAVPTGEVTGPKAPAAIGLIGHTAADLGADTESRVTASLSQNQGTVVAPTLALYVRQPVTYTASKDKINTV